MRKIWETGIILFAVAGFWGMIYPDLCFTNNVCKTVYEEIHTENEKDLFTQICEADEGQVRVKSKILESFAKKKELKKSAGITESKGKSNAVNKGKRNTL